MSFYLLNLLRGVSIASLLLVMVSSMILIVKTFSQVRSPPENSPYLVV